MNFLKHELGYTQGLAVSSLKVVIYNYVYVGFNSMSNLILIFSIISLYFCEILCKGYV